MFEEILKKKEDKIAFLNAVITKVLTNEGEDILELQEELIEIKPYFEENKFFIKEVNRNFKRLKKVFTDEKEYERALAFVRARKVRNHIIRRAEEALGYREIASDNFENYQLVVKRVETVIRKEMLIEKINFKNTLFTLTTSEGFKDVDNHYYTEIIKYGNKVIDSLKKKGVYNPEDCEIQLEYEDEETKEVILLPLRITCEKVDKRK